MTRTQRTVGALAITVAFVVVVTAFALATLTDPARGDALGDGAGRGEVATAATTPSAVTRTVTATQRLTIPAGVVRLTETPAPLTPTVAATSTVVREDFRTVTAEGVRTEVRTQRVTERAIVTETVVDRGATVTDVVTETVQGPGGTVVQTVTETVQGAAPPPQTVTETVQGEAPPAETVTVTETVAGDSGP